jgi:hypothetical protein
MIAHGFVLVIQTIHAMSDAGDDQALEELWTLLGGEGSLGTGARERPARAELLIQLVRSACLPKGDIYAAERTALAELARTFAVDASKHATVERLEDAIVDEMAEQVRARLEAMDDDKRRQFAEDMLRRMPDEERIRLIDRVLQDFDQLSAEERDAFIQQLATELKIDPDVLDGAVAGGAATLLPLLLAKQAGFSVFISSTKLMYVVASKAGVTLPFAVYMIKNRALGWLLGPVGLIVTTGLSAGWFAVKSWRRRERFKKLMQIVAYTTAWRHEQERG